MWQVKGEYTDYSKRNFKGTFYLNSDQAFNPYTWKPPIHWEGTVSGEKVKFTQTDSGGFSSSCFDWSDFPKELEEAIGAIVEAIDDAMRVMD